jgi:hypothetical protein
VCCGIIIITTTTTPEDDLDFTATTTATPHAALVGNRGFGGHGVAPPLRTTMLSHDAL